MAAEQLNREPPHAARAAAVLERGHTIQRLIARINRLIGDLGDVASIEAGRFPVTMAPGDLLAPIRQAVESFQRSAGRHGIELAALLQGTAIEATFDRDRMVQVLANLLANAIEFAPRGSRVTIRAGSAAGEVRVSVADAGPGIPAGQLDAIFSKFWQAARRERRGLGLGLYLSRCIVEVHGGRIWAESEPGTGTRLCFALPSNPAARAG